ncbi:c-type cytochrome [Aliidiomarina minuta]|uniref:c-type cytochrome n=1 Tax=Aliidiomarina minuta TaxID=880057 RepID=UPI001F540FA5|nr:c-type cytochrome [Aliidiomarina minuta]
MKVLKLGKWNKFLALVAGVAIASGVAVAQDSGSLEDRIKPSGRVLMAGDVAATPGAGDSNGARAGDQVYNQACAACHAGGVLGAPKVNDAGDWADRLGQGMETLVRHTIEGFNAMPPRGGCANCSDEEIESAIEYMTSEL